MTGNDFHLLSKDIINNRRLISELRLKVQNLEYRVWNAEEHTPAEDLERTTAMLAAYIKAVGKYNVVVKSSDDSAGPKSE